MLLFGEWFGTRVPPRPKREGLLSAFGLSIQLAKGKGTMTHIRRLDHGTHTHTGQVACKQLMVLSLN